MGHNDTENVDTPVDYDTWCRTKVGEEAKFKFVWTIERFSERPEKTSEVSVI